MSAPPRPARWWEVVLGGLAFAVSTYALIWAFALLEVVLAP